jgi:hypothetical protein
MAAEGFGEEQPRLLPLPLHPFNPDHMVVIRPQKTILVRFDRNDYSFPPEELGRPLTLVASDSVIRILDGTQEIARHPRSYDRQTDGRCEQMAQACDVLWVSRLIHF